MKRESNILVPQENFYKRIFKELKSIVNDEELTESEEELSIKKNKIEIKNH